MRGGDYAVEAHQEMTELSMDHRYRDIFLCESYAHLQSFREHLIHLAENKEEQAELQEVFRNIHTIKGMAATTNDSSVPMAAPFTPKPNPKISN